MGLSPDKQLAFSYLPARHRPAIEALFDLDKAMGDVIRSTTEPALGEIRLAWWRERLEELDADVNAPDEPRLKAIERELKPRGISPSNLAGQTYAWERLLEPFPWDTDITGAIAFRGEILFTHARLIIEGPGELVGIGGDVWALVDAARHCSDPVSRTLLLEEARLCSEGLVGQTFPSNLRPLTMLTRLAMRDLAHSEPFEPEGTPGRAAVLFAHRWSGRIG